MDEKFIPLLIYRVEGKILSSRSYIIFKKKGKEKKKKGRFRDEYLSYFHKEKQCSLKIDGKDDGTIPQGRNPRSNLFDLRGGTARRHAKERMDRYDAIVVGNSNKNRTYPPTETYPRNIVAQHRRRVDPHR